MSCCCVPSFAQAAGGAPCAVCGMPVLMPMHAPCPGAHSIAGMICRCSAGCVKERSIVRWQGVSVWCEAHTTAVPACLPACLSVPPHLHLISGAADLTCPDPKHTKTQPIHCLYLPLLPEVGNHTELNSALGALPALAHTLSEHAAALTSTHVPCACLLSSNQVGMQLLSTLCCTHTP
jgi:hypothetical protein